MPEITRGERYLSYSMYCSLKLCRRMLTRADYWQYFFANDRNNTWGDVLKLQYVLQSQTLQKDAGTCRVLAVFFANSLNDKISVAIPMAVGLKANIFPRFVLGVEWSFRKTFTDDLDNITGEDLSIYNSHAGVYIEKSKKQIGFLYTKDWYSMAYITLSYTFKLGGVSCNAYK